MQLRPATPEDIPLLRQWDEQPHVLESGVEDWDWEDMLAVDPPWRALLIAETAGRPIGFLQIIDPAEEDTHYWGDCGPNLRAIDIWIGEADAIGRGNGRRMMTLAIERCFAAPNVTAILIDPLDTNTRAHRFYEALGFRLIGPRRFGDDDCLVYRLTRADWRQGD